LKVLRQNIIKPLIRINKQKTFIGGSTQEISIGIDRDISDFSH
jgi:hypothetical protein